jgi:hypothetical protein
MPAHSRRIVNARAFATVIQWQHPGAVHPRLEVEIASTMLRI